MISHYSHTNALESFTIKWTCVKALSLAAEAVGKKDEYGAWQFVWGDVPTHVKDTTLLKQKARVLAADITVEEPSNFSRTGRKLFLPAKLTSPNGRQPLDVKAEPKDCEAEVFVDEALADKSSSSSSDTSRSSCSS